MPKRRSIESPLGAVAGVVPRARTWMADIAEQVLGKDGGSAGLGAHGGDGAVGDLWRGGG